MKIVITMLRCVLLVSCFVLLVQACVNHEECRVEFELQDDGDLGVVYHAPDDHDYDKVTFKLFLGKGRKQTSVDQVPETHENHEDWEAVFTKRTPFVACDTYKIRTIAKGTPNFKRTDRVQIPGPECPELN